MGRVLALEDRRNPRVSAPETGVLLRPGCVCADCAGPRPAMTADER